MSTQAIQGAKAPKAPQAVQGEVVQMNTLKGSQFVKIKRKDGSFFVAEFPEGDHRSFNLGPLPKPVFGMQKQAEQFKTKDGLVDHYLFVGEQARESTATRAPVEGGASSVSANSQTPEGLDEPTKSIEVDFKLSPISDYAAVEIVKASWDLAIKFYNYRDERKDFLKIVKQLQFDLVQDMCNVMNKCETGDKNFFNQ